MSLIQSVEAIREMYLDRSDSLDASSYEVEDLCDEVLRLRAALAEAQVAVEKLENLCDYATRVLYANRAILMPFDSDAVNGIADAANRSRKRRAKQAIDSLREAARGEE